MSRLLCDCGHLINFTVVPCKAEWMLVPSDVDDSTALAGLYDKSHAVLRCRQCGCLWVQWTAGGEYRRYAPDPDPAKTGDAPVDKFRPPSEKLLDWTWTRCAAWTALLLWVLSGVLVSIFLDHARSGAFLLTATFALTGVLCVATLAWMVGRAIDDHRIHRWRRTAEYGIQSDEDFRLAIGADTTRFHAIQVIRRAMAHNAKRLQPEQIVAAMPMWTFVAKADFWDGWDPSDIIMELEDRLNLSLPGADSSFMNITDEKETVGGWVMRIMDVLPR